MLVLSVAFAVLYWAATDSEPAVPETKAPNPQQVQAAHALFAKAREGNEGGKQLELVLSDSDIQAISAMLAPSFAPNRMGAELNGDTLTLTATRKFGPRWINAEVQFSGESEGIPPFRIRFGSITLPGRMSRELVEAMRRRMANSPQDLPSLDSIVQSINVANDKVRLAVTMPDPSRIDAALRPGATKIAPERVGAIYCALAEQQAKNREILFTKQLQRAIASSKPNAADQGAALVALSMFVVDYRTAELVGGAREAAEACRVSPIAVTLDGRSDWASHWSLSAALTVTLGAPVALAMGEWKEVADSAPDKAKGAGIKPTGFSFSDVAADRSGYAIARRLTTPGQAVAARKAVLVAGDLDVLPRSATRRHPPMTNTEFQRRFGDISSPRFEAEIKQIDIDIFEAWESLP